MRKPTVKYFRFHRFWRWFKVVVVLLALVVFFHYVPLPDVIYLVRSGLSAFGHFVTLAGHAVRESENVFVAVRRLNSTKLFREFTKGIGHSKPRLDAHDRLTAAVLGAVG
jgi:hypothetical protein